MRRLRMVFGVRTIHQFKTLNSASTKERSLRALLRIERLWWVALPLMTPMQTRMTLVVIFSLTSAVWSHLADVSYKYDQRAFIGPICIRQTAPSVNLSAAIVVVHPSAHPTSEHLTGKIRHISAAT